MKRTLGFLFFFVVTSVHADVAFVCSYKNLFEVSGRLDEAKGGKLRLNGSYVTGWKFPEFKNFYRNIRPNENKLEYAKFDIKTKQQYKNSVWLPVYYKFSIPKAALTSKVKNFKGYFSYYEAEAPDENIMEELPALDCKRK